MSWWFFVICAVEILILLISVEQEAPIASIVSLLLFGGAAYFFDINIWTLVQQNKSLLFIIIPIYFFFGLWWSLAKWRLHVTKMHQTEGRDINYLRDLLDLNKHGNKKRITNWISFWPISVINYLCFDLLLSFADSLYNLFKFLFNKITELTLGKEIYQRMYNKDK